MTDLRKAAEMALKELEGLYPFDTPSKKALRQALAQEVTTQVKWVGLTDEEIFLCNEYPVDECCEASIRRAEARLREKNSG